MKEFSTLIYFENNMKCFAHILEEVCYNNNKIAV